jgi:hypothetical protein
VTPAPLARGSFFAIAARFRACGVRFHHLTARSMDAEAHTMSVGNRGATGVVIDRWSRDPLRRIDSAKPGQIRRRAPRRLP